MYFSKENRFLFKKFSAKAGESNSRRRDAAKEQLTPWKISRKEWLAKEKNTYRTIFMRGLATAQMVIQAKAAILPVEDPNWPYRIRIPVTSESPNFLAQLEG